MMGGAPHAHAPAAQILPPVQEIPHAPQLSVLVCVSTQLFTQLVSPVVQVAAHALLLQTGAAGAHFVGHAPQWSGSLVSSTQTPPQFVAVGEMHSQIALLQVKPAPQTLPHAPQLLGSSRRRTHWPPQSTLPFEVPPSLPVPLQPPAVHAPARQTSPFAHFVLQPPQFKRSTVTSTHTLLQESSPAGHPHLPEMHCAPFWQTLPHAPQFWLSLFSSTHELLQSVRPVTAVLHPAAHLPMAQTAIVLTQFVPQAPQFFGFSERLTQTPLHSVVPAAQPHAPWRQSFVAAHVVPHAPQLLGSLCLSTHDLPHVESALPASPTGHASTQRPRLHTGVVPLQMVPHAPQLLGSDRRFAHAPLAHFTSVSRQTAGPASASGVPVSTPESFGCGVTSGLPVSLPPASSGIVVSSPLSSPPQAGSAMAAPTQPAAISTAM